MSTSGHILVINPGSTSTKLAMYQYDLSDHSLSLSNEENLQHGSPGTGPILDELEEREAVVRGFVKKTGIQFDLIMSRGAPLRPIQGGIYQVNEVMLNDIRSARYAEHASNLGPLIGQALSEELGIPVYIADPITTDEFKPLARVSGVPGIERISRSHALNIKASVRKVLEGLDLVLEDSSWVVAHLGGGISIAAVQNGKIIDVNDALLGMGPFSPARAGALPIEALMDLVASYEGELSALKAKLSRDSGLKGYLGTSDMPTIETRIDNGDTEAEHFFKAMIYQISKEMAAMSAVLDFKADGFILTGGLAHSAMVCDPLMKLFNTQAPVHIVPGENELLALAEAGMRLLAKEESPLTYENSAQEVS